MWQDIITSILTSGLITGIFVFILNKTIENKFDMKLEAYKDKLKAESDKELLQLTKDLELKASERNIKLTTYFPKQADTVSELYSKMVVLKRTLDKFAESSKDLKVDNTEQITAMAQAYSEFDNYFVAVKILIPKKTRDLITEFQKSSTSHFSYYLLHMDKEPTENVAEWKIEIIEGVKKMPALLESMENDFQDILGITTNKK